MSVRVGSAVRKNIVLLSLTAAGAAIAPGALAQQVQEAEETAFRVPGEKPAIAHVPVVLTDPATKKPLDPKKQYSEDGRKRTGEQIHEDYNAWEQHMNAHGMHLKDADGKNIQELAVDDALEKARHEQHTASMKPIAPWQNQFHAAKGKPAVKAKGAHSTPRGAHAPAKPINVAQTWAYDKSAGDDKNGLDIGGSFKIHISDQQQRAEAEGHFKGFLLSKEYDLLMIDAFAEADETSPTAGGSHSAWKITSIDGKELWSKNFDSAANPVISGKLPVFNWTGDRSWKYGFKAGPIHVNVDLALKASLGMDVNYALDFKSARADATPHVDGAVDAKWSMDIKIASGGINGTVNLIKDDADFGGSAVLQESADGQKAQLDLNISGVNDIDALSGVISWWVKAGWCGPLCWKPSGTLVKWNSVLKAKTTVFSWNQPIDVFNVPPMASEPLTLLKQNGSSFVTTGSTIVQGYSNGGVLGKIAPGPGTGLQPLYACVYTKNQSRKVKVAKPGTKPIKYDEQTVNTPTATGDHFESLDAKCEGHMPAGIIGYVWSAAGAGMKQLSRCKQGNFSTLAASCSGGAEQMHFFVQNP